MPLLLVWIGLFAFWVVALRWAAGRAFPDDPLPSDEARSRPARSRRSHPLFFTSVAFHAGLAITLAGVLLSAGLESLSFLWLGLPGAAGLVFWGAWLEYERLQALGREPELRRLSPWWLKEQWPFALLGLTSGLAGLVWTLSGQSLYPLLLVLYALFFLFQLYFFHVSCNGVTVTASAVTYRRSFPRWRLRQKTWPRAPDLRVHLSQSPAGRRLGLWHVEIINGTDVPVVLEARLTAFQRAQWEDALTEGLGTRDRGAWRIV